MFGIDHYWTRAFDREALRNTSKETRGAGRLPLHYGKRRFSFGASLVCHCVPCYPELGPLSLNVSEEMERQGEVSGFPEHPLMNVLIVIQALPNFLRVKIET